MLEGSALDAIKEIESSTDESNSPPKKEDINQFYWDFHAYHQLLVKTGENSDITVLIREKVAENGKETIKETPIFLHQYILNGMFLNYIL